MNIFKHFLIDLLNEFHSHSFFPLLFWKGELTDLKLVIEDTIDNVATLQDCSVDQEESLQLLGENRSHSLTSRDTNMQLFYLNTDDVGVS